MTARRLAGRALRSTAGLFVAVALAVAMLPGQGRALEALFAPSADLWERWTAHDPAALKRIDHGAWAAFLTHYLETSPDGVNRVDYAGVTPEDRRALDAYTARLAATPIDSYRRAEQLAYWINLYNALTVRLILEHYPVASIRDIDISPGWFSDGPWGRKLVRIEGEAVSLDDIEHRILRPIWRDPRIHYALNCAAVGCPNLMPIAFTAENADDLMTDAAREYVNHPRGARVADGRLVVSSVYVWYQEDFGDSDAGVIAHLRRYARLPLADLLAGITDIDDDHYDWALND